MQTALSITLSKPAQWESNWGTEESLLSLKGNNVFSNSKLHGLVNSYGRETSETASACLQF